MSVFDLSDAQATYILDLQLRRLTKFSRIELEKERDELERLIEQLRAILADERLLRRTVSTELDEVAKAHGTPRRTVLLESAGVPAAVTHPLEVADDPCWCCSRRPGCSPGPPPTSRSPPAVSGPSTTPWVSVVAATARGQVGLVTSAGRLVRLSVLELPTLPPTSGAPALSGGTPLKGHIELDRGEEVVGLASLLDGADGLALGTAAGVVKRVLVDYPAKDSFELIGLRPGDRVVGAAAVPREDVDLVFVTSDAQLLRFPSVVRPSPGPTGWGHGRHQAGLRGRCGPLRGGRPRAGRGRCHLRGHLRCAARHPARLAQGHPYAEYPARAAAPAGCGATGSSRVRTPWSSVGRGCSGARQCRERRSGGATGGTRPPGWLWLAREHRHRRDRPPPSPISAASWPARLSCALWRCLRAGRGRVVIHPNVQKSRFAPEMPQYAGPETDYCTFGCRARSPRAQAVAGVARREHAVARSSAQEHAELGQAPRTHGAFRRLRAALPSTRTCSSPVSRPKCPSMPAPKPTTARLAVGPGTPAQAVARRARPGAQDPRRLLGRATAAASGRRAQPGAQDPRRFPGRLRAALCGHPNMQ